MKNYESVYKNTGTTPRTMGEAYKNADYATPIYRMRTELDEARDFLVEMVLGMVLVGLPMVALYGVAVWLGLLK